MTMCSFTSSKTYSVALLGLSVVLMTTTSALAQVPSSATGTASPARVEEQFAADLGVPQLSSRVQVKDLILQEVPDGAENINLTLNTVELTGVTVYTQAELEPVYADKMGQAITLADVYGIATALTNKYRNEGYILTQVVVPPQTIEDGAVTLQVVEGFVSNISVEGDDAESAINLVERYAHGIDTDKALNVEDLERYLLMISDLPGVEARSILSPAAGQPGAADLRIIVSRDPYDALLAVDNYGSRYLGPIQFSASGSLNSYFGNNERITGQVVLAPDPGTDSEADLELGYFSVGYDQPITLLGKGTTASLFASHTDTRPGFDLAPFEVEGISRYMSASLSHPFIRSRTQNLIGRLTFDWRQLESRSNVQNTLEDNIRAVRANANYEFLDTLVGVGVNSIGLQASHGLDVFGASGEGDANMTRGSGDPQFWKLNADVRRLQRLTSDVNLLVAGSGQWTTDALLSSEEFGVGGVNFGRGYDPSEIIGDKGIAGKVELQWNTPAPVDFLDSYQVFGFYDAGRVWNEDPTNNAQKRDGIASTGLGLRTNFMDAYKGDMFVALPLTRDVQTQNDTDARFYFSLSRSF